MVMDMRHVLLVMALVTMALPAKAEDKAVAFAFGYLKIGRTIYADTAAGKESTVEEASRLAVENCNQHPHGEKTEIIDHCKIVKVISSGCGSLTTGQSRKDRSILGYGFGADRESAVADCRSKGMNCSDQDPGFTRQCLP
jgi:hypothetical protein